MKHPPDSSKVHTNNFLCEKENSFILFLSVFKNEAKCTVFENYQKWSHCSKVAIVSSKNIALYSN